MKLTLCSTHKNKVFSTQNTMCSAHKIQSALQKILILFRVFSTLRTSWHLTVKQWTHNYKQNMTSVDRSAWFSSAAADIDCEKKVKSHIWASEQHLYLPTNRTLINICKTSSFLRSLVCWWLFWPINCLVNIKTRKAGSAHGQNLTFTTQSGKAGGRSRMWKTTIYTGRHPNGALGAIIPQCRMQWGRDLHWTGGGGGAGGNYQHAT